MHHIKLQQFEGPFDLLLSLIENQKLDISLISLAHIVDDYLHVIKEQNPSAREKSEFVLMASRLLYVKACVLAKVHAPQEAVEEQSNLVQQLWQYKQYKDAALHLQNTFEIFPQMMNRPNQKITGYKWPAHAHPAGMVDIYLGAISQLKRMLVVPNKSVRPTLSLKEAHTKLSEVMTKKESVLFKEMVGDCPDSSHVVVYFLALLHMIATKQVDYDQQGLFCDIMVKRVNYAHDAAIG